MWFFDVDTLRFVAVNDAAVEKYGYTREEFLAMTIKEIRPPEEVDRLLRVTGRVAQGLNTTPGWRHRAKDGRIFDVEIIGYPVPYAGRACELILVHDVTERREAEARLEELRAQLAISDRMAAIGTLAAGVAHEINNPLTWILANVNYAAEQLERFGAPSAAEARAVREALDEAVDGTARVRAIVRDLKTFSRSEEEGVGPVELVRVAAAALNLAANEVKHRARVVVEVAGAPPVLGNEARLGQVLLNLIVNAAHAIPDGRASEQEIRITARREGDRVELRVSDTGPGVDPSIASRIFDPFFTTKPVGQGTGLGLWVCRRLVEGLGGSIDVVPGTGSGATFRILLPVAEAGPPAPAPTRPELPPAARRASVLVVDDEPLVGRALARSLAAVARVEVETSGRAALARLGRGERFDLVLSDVMMPDLAGAELHAALARLDPALAEAVVFMTGGAFSQAEQEFLGRIPNTCLEKPLHFGRLRELIRGRIA
jgi:PAS domain S-box-containing protein